VSLALDSRALILIETDAWRRRINSLSPKIRHLRPQQKRTMCLPFAAVIQASTGSTSAELMQSKVWLTETAAAAVVVCVGVAIRSNPAPAKFRGRVNAFWCNITSSRMRARSSDWYPL
jgi:hypothetical protein